MAVVRRESRRFTIVVTVLVVLGALPMALTILLAGAPKTLLIATLLAALPVPVLVACYLWLDRYEPEPRRLLVLGLLWGAFAATGGALLLQVGGTLLLGVGDIAAMVVLAPVTEEATKGVFLLLLLWWRRHTLDGILDGVVYAGMVGVGFAFTENVLYLASAYEEGPALGVSGPTNLGVTFVIRGLVSPFAHPLFTTFIGVGVGIAIASRSPAVRTFAPLGGYLLAVVTHAIWNGAAALGAFVPAYVVLMVPLFAGVAAFAVWARYSERRLLTTALQDAADRGLIPATDIGWVTELPARRAARRHARSIGPEHHQAMSDYQQALIEFGYLHHRYLKGTPPPDFAARGQQYIASIGALRPQLAFPGQVVPPR